MFRVSRFNCGIEKGRFSRRAPGFGLEQEGECVGEIHARRWKKVRALLGAEEYRQVLLLSRYCFCELMKVRKTKQERTNGMRFYENVNFNAVMECKNLSMLISSSISLCLWILSTQALDRKLCFRSWCDASVGRIPALKKQFRGALLLCSYEDLRCSHDYT